MVAQDHAREKSKMEVAHVLFQLFRVALCLAVFVFAVRFLSAMLLSFCFASALSFGSVLLSFSFGSVLLVQAKDQEQGQRQERTTERTTCPSRWGRTADRRTKYPSRWGDASRQED